MCVVALPGGMGQVPEQRDFWSHVKHLLWGLVPQQEAQQERPDRSRQAGKACLLVGIPQRGKGTGLKYVNCGQALQTWVSYHQFSLGSTPWSCSAWGLCWRRWPGGLECPPMLAGAGLGWAAAGSD